MAISTYGITLRKGTKTANVVDYSATLVDIKAFPDLGATPQTIETTTLSDKAQTFIKGVDANVTLEFTANYDADKYEELLTMSDNHEPQHFAVFFGDEGQNGKFALEGQLSVWVVGGGVNGVVDMKIGIVPSAAITRIN